jgi:hypothetical protein
MTNPIRPGDVVTILAFDDVSEHLFRVDEVHDDCVTGVALTGPLAGEYGEPDLSLVSSVAGISPDHQSH